MTAKLLSRCLAIAKVQVLYQHYVAPRSREYLEKENATLRGLGLLVVSMKAGDAWTKCSWDLVERLSFGMLVKWSSFGLRSAA